MKKSTFIWIAICLFTTFVLAATDEKIDTNSIEVESQEDDFVTIPVQQHDNKPLPAIIDPEVNQELPVKVDVNISKPLEVELALKHNEGLTVRGKGQTDEWLSVKLKPDNFPLVVSVVATLATLAIAGVTLWTALTARKSAKAAEKSAAATERSAEGQLFFDLIREYSSRAMLTDMNIVFDWYRNIDIDENNQKLADEAAKEWIDQLYEKKTEGAIAMNHARRHITHFFLHILDLEESKYVDKGFARRITEAVGTGVLGVVFPLEKALMQYIDKRDGVSPGETRKRILELRAKFEKLKELGNDPYKG